MEVLGAEGGNAGPRRAAAVACLLATLGCVAYRPKPLTPEAVEASLATPAADTIRVESERLCHPALPPVVVDLADGLTPDEAAVLAVLLNPDLRAERDRLALGDAQVLAARILPNPQLSYSHDLLVTDTPGLVTGFAVGVSQSIQEMVTRHRRVESAEADRAAIVLDVAWREWQAAEAAKTALYSLVVMEQRERLAVEADGRLEANLGLVRRAVASGQLTAADLAAAEGASQEARSTLLDTRGALSMLRIELNRLLGLPASAKVEPQAGVALPDDAVAANDADLEAHLEDRRLDLQALREGYGSQEAALHAAVLGQFPRLSVGLGRARDTGGVVTHGISLTVDLPLFDRNQAQIAAATATRQAVWDEYAARLFQARADVAGASAEMRALGGQLRAQQAGEEAFRKLEEAYHRALERSQVSALDYVTAWNAYRSAVTRGIVLREQLLQARLRLELASGLYDVARGGEGADPR